METKTEKGAIINMTDTDRVLEAYDLESTKFSKQVSEKLLGAKKVDRISFEILAILKKENLSIAHAQDLLQHLERAIDNMLSFVKVPDYTAFVCPNCKKADLFFEEAPPNFCGQCGTKDPFHLEDALS